VTVKSRFNWLKIASRRALLKKTVESSEFVGSRKLLNQLTVGLFKEKPVAWSYAQLAYYLPI
jgi:hypothetical protein